jgi:dihydrofolate reductase
MAYISCIGGRTLAADLLAERLIDDLYLTTGRNVGGEPNTALPQSAFEGSTVARKLGTGEEADVRFTHLHLS